MSRVLLLALGFCAVTGAVVDGFTVEHCANQGASPQIGATDVRSGKRWFVENDTVRHAKTAGKSGHVQALVPQVLTTAPGRLK